MNPSGAIRKISFVVPVYNEEENIPHLVREIVTTAGTLGYPYEILLVDDGSRDGTLSAIKSLAVTTPELKYVSFSENRGQSAALYAGFQNASGDTVITLDGDLQNDPKPGRSAGPSTAHPPIGFGRSRTKKASFARDAASMQ